MKAFVITIKDNPKSVESAERCIESGRKNGCAIRKFDAITPKDNPEFLFFREGLSYSGMIEQYSRTPNCAAAFLSHYSLWQKCIQLKETIVIFEHDAVLKSPIPSSHFLYVMNIGHPSYGKWNTPSILGVNKLISKPYMPGAHAYMITPQGAELLIRHAKKSAKPTDVFMNVKSMPWLQEYYPWPAVADDSFTTIQSASGTIAKHNEVEIIDA
jgi:GR25 family glycosyltransferase involved in LPS biosynthesis